MGILYELVVIVAWSLMAWFAITQIVLPMANGTQMFPFFHKRKELEEKMVEVAQDLDNAKLEKEIKKVAKEAKEKRRG